MCLLIIAHRAVSGLPLAVAANRDEFHARPTAPATFWNSHPELLAGRDLEQGGTWMGVTRGGRFAAVTNYRDPARSAPAPRSRGELPLEFLTGAQSPADYLDTLSRRAQEYAGFNLLLGDREALWYYHNAPGEQPHRLEPGIYGLSNARLDTPWPKVERGKRELAAALATGGASHDSLAAAVADRRPAALEELRPGGADAHMERLLSAQFIISERYGTRSMTTLWVAAGRAHWRERSFHPDGRLAGEQEETFALRPADCG